MSTIQGISHVSLSVRDLAVSIGFYRDLFGFTPIEQVAGDGWQGTICVHPGGVIVNFQQHEANAGEVFTPHRTGLDHLSFRVSERADLDAWAQRLASLGVAHSPIAEARYGSVLSLVDPDGIQLELFYREGHP